MRLNQITIPSLDLNKSVPFYEKLGLQLIVLALPHYARFLSPEGDTTFSIQKVETLIDGLGAHVYFECDELEAKVEELKAKGIQFETAITNQPWLWREAALKDPDNNHIILYYAGENRLNPPWKLK